MHTNLATICFVSGAFTVGLTGSAFALSGGDDATTATPITSLPFADTDDTTPLTDQFDVVCPFSGSTSPDAWYRYEATGGELLSVRLCDSAYDTKVYVLDADFNDVACNDDACLGNFRSEITTPALAPGTHYLVVDGWSGDAGIYDISIDLADPCIITCPDGATPEGEPCDDTGGTSTNGGCNQSPPIFGSLVCGETICGQAWALNGTRDTDWYLVPPTGSDTPTLFEVSVTSGFSAAVFAFEVGCSCDSECTVVPNFVLQTQPCTTASDAFVRGPNSTSQVFVGTSTFDLLPCGSVGAATNDYIVSAACSDDIPPDPCPTLGDVNADGFVDFVDLLTVLANFGTCP